MGRPKGGKNRYWSKEDKLKIVKRVIEQGESSQDIQRNEGIPGGMIRKWVIEYLDKGESALENKRKPGNPLAKYVNKKNLTKIEVLEYENMKLRIENLRLKKGYTEKEVISIRNRSSKKSMK